MIKPTIGRVVWYWPTHKVDSPLPALICHVWSDTCINIGGFDQDGRPFGETSVLLHQYGNPRPTQKFAEWMPYQIGQAKKNKD